MKTNKYPIFLVSACLLGLETRYDGKSKINSICLKHLAGSNFIPFCPEQLGGLATPRNAADISGGDGNDVLAGRARVITRQGDDLTLNFIKGAELVLRIARFHNIAGVFVKARSPSCGITPRLGVTSALLKINGYELQEF